MFLTAIANAIVDFVVQYGKELLMPIMIVVWVFSVVSRMLTYYTVRRQEWFTNEFSKRVTRFIESEDSKRTMSFFVTTKRLLEKTFYELFEVRGIMKRRKLDYITTPSDRLFLIQHGSAWIVKDTLKQVKFLKFNSGNPKFLEVSKTVLQNNPCYNKLFGIIPVGPLNDVLHLIPGLFILGGIFGTFLGIIKALPELGSMDMNDPEGTKIIMETFLLKISFSMAASVFGILLSVTVQILNTIFSPEKLFFDVVNRLDNTLSNLWNRCDNNELPEQIKDFDEHKDPIDALAELAVNKEIGSRAGKKEDARLSRHPGHGHKDDHGGNDQERKVS